MQLLIVISSVFLNLALIVRTSHIENNDRWVKESGKRFELLQREFYLEILRTYPSYDLHTWCLESQFLDSECEIENDLVLSCNASSSETYGLSGETYLLLNNSGGPEKKNFLLSLKGTKRRLTFSPTFKIDNREALIENEKNTTYLNRVRFPNWPYRTGWTYILGGKTYALLDIDFYGVNISQMEVLVRNLRSQDILIENVRLRNVSINSTDLKNALSLMKESLLSIQIVQTTFDTFVDFRNISFKQLGRVILCNNTGSQFLFSSNFIVRQGMEIDPWHDYAGLKVCSSEVINTHLNIILNGSIINHTVFWVGNMYPRFFQMKPLGHVNNHQVIYKNIFVSGPKYLTKDVFAYLGPIDWPNSYLRINVSNIDRIEFGALANTNAMILGGLTRNESLETRLFLDGDCTALSCISIDSCMICFMHQYGLHKTDDNLAELCKMAITPKLPPKKCYWGPYMDLPEEVAGLDIMPFQTDSAIKNVPYCRPKDVPGKLFFRNPLFHVRKKNC